jgi:hypothetical protein
MEILNSASTLESRGNHLFCLLQHCVLPTSFISMFYMFLTVTVIVLQNRNKQLVFAMEMHYAFCDEGTEFLIMI